MDIVGGRALFLYWLRLIKFLEEQFLSLHRLLVIGYWLFVISYWLKDFIDFTRDRELLPQITYNN